MSAIQSKIGSGSSLVKKQIKKSYWVSTNWNDHFYIKQYFADDTNDLKKQFDAKAKEWTSEMIERNPDYVAVDTEWEFVMAENEPKKIEEFLAAHIQYHISTYEASN